MGGKATYNYTSLDLGTPALYIRTREKNHEKKFQNPTPALRFVVLLITRYPYNLLALKYLYLCNDHYTFATAKFISCTIYRKMFHSVPHLAPKHCARFQIGLKGNIKRYKSISYA